MNHRITALLASAAMTFVAGSAFAQTAAPAPPPPPTLAPSMSVSLAANGSPASYDLGLLGNKVYVTGALTGLALTEDHSVAGTISNQADISNAQIFINKADGLVQYYVEVGDYSFPSLGYPYVKSGPATTANFGVVPEAYIKIAPTSSFSIQGGKLPTLIGSEYNFTFQNLNIERGLLWGFEPAVSRGVQANYSQGPFAVSVSWNDGLYSNQYNTVSGLATWTITPTDTLAVAASGTTKKTTFSALNNQTIYNVIYTHTMGQWTFNPYFQYEDIPKYVPVGQTASQQIASGALLVNYAFDSKSMLAGVSLPLRGEYVSSTGFQKYNVYSITFTPTFQYKIYFVRAEVSYTAANIGLFGPTGAAKSQTRGLVETGVLF
ncbi:MAG TPA: outer membrane beta-barrel protein [Caulobacteraceae bacterium]|nr:outer membrane beta-barrel protein [Caulobacteraceae bacterium]